MGSNPGNKMWTFFIMSLMVASTMSVIPFTSGSSYLSSIDQDQAELTTESDPYSIYGYALQYDGTSAAGDYFS